MDDVVAYYADRGLMARVDGRQPVEAVTAAILAAADGDILP
jgi:adenylate kinase family enzyme